MLLPFRFRLASAASLSFLLVACGGGSGGTSGAGAATTVMAPAPAIIVEANAPRLTGNAATDGLNWINFRRQQIGVQQLLRNNAIDTAAQGHSDYQKDNNTITHTQIFGNPGFTGVRLADRLTAAGYRFKSSSFAFGEVIASTADTSGANAAEDLITAIYHRFVIFEPMFKEAGVGGATISGGYTYFTANLVSDNLDRGLGAGKMVTYPVDAQQNVLRQFSSDNETPDPVPNKNLVGFPVSVHADVGSTVKTRSFTLTPRCGVPAAPGCGVALAASQTLLLTAETDAQRTPSSAASLIPLEVLAEQTTYDARFIGTVNGVEVNRGWSFMTR